MGINLIINISRLRKVNSASYVICGYDMYVEPLGTLGKEEDENMRRNKKVER